MNGVQTHGYSYKARNNKKRVGVRVYNAEAIFDNFTIYNGAVKPSGNERPGDLILTDYREFFYDCKDAEYEETSGDWVDKEIYGTAFGDENCRYSTTGGEIVFSFYPSINHESNLLVKWYNPYKNSSEIDIYIQTLNGAWKYQVKANSEIGWHKLGIVSANEGTAFTLTAGSRCQTADCCRLERRFEIGGFEACAAQSGRRMHILIG